jgi:hypothetical protein
VVTTSRTKFSKDLVHYSVLGIFGANIVVSEGEEWKKYRKIAAPAFSEVCLEVRWLPKSEYDCQRNNKLVWDETTRVILDLFDNVWGDGSEIVVDHFLDITLPVRFLCLILTPVLTSLPDRPLRHQCSR